MNGCPNCGSFAYEIIHVRKSLWGVDESCKKNVRCSNCSYQYTLIVEQKRAAQEDYEAENFQEQTTNLGIVFISEVKGGATCPQCGKFPVRVTSTEPDSGTSRIRWHKCTCGWRGKSVENTK